MSNNHHDKLFKKFVFGTPDEDVLNGTNGHDIVFGFGGDDQIFGLRGNDIAFGGRGDDRVDGGKDHDVLFGEHGNDGLAGGDGNDGPAERIRRASLHTIFHRYSDRGERGINLGIALRQDGGGKCAGAAADVQPIQAVPCAQPVKKAWRDLTAPASHIGFVAVAGLPSIMAGRLCHRPVLLSHHYIRRYAGAGELRSLQCPSWVKLGRGGMSALSPFYPQLRTLVGAAGTAAQCQQATCDF